MSLKMIMVNVIIGLMLSELQRPEDIISSDMTKIVFSYCDRLVNVIRFDLAQSDHIKQCQLYIIATNYN